MARKKKRSPPKKAVENKPGRWRRARTWALPTREEWRAHRLELGLSLAAGLLMILPWPRIDLWPLAWVGLAPFLFALTRTRGKMAVWCGLAFGWTFFYGNIFWLNTLYTFNVFIPLGILLLPFYCAAPTLLFSWLAARWLERRPTLSFLLLPALWCFLEFFRALGRLAFPWAFLGHSQWAWNDMVQLSSITGVYGISFLIVLSNLALAQLTARALRPPTRDWKWLLGVPVVLAAVAGVGYLLGGLKVAEPPREPFRIALIQPNIDQETKFKSYGGLDAPEEEQLRCWRTMWLANYDRTKQALAAEDNADGVDLIVWPESAVTNYNFSELPQLHDALTSWSRNWGAPIFLGAGNVEPSGGKIPFIYNSAFLIEPETGLSDKIYDKMRLVPFGEHLPYFKLIPGLRSVVGILDFSEGDEFTIFDISHRRALGERARFGALICFESGFSRLARQSVLQGAEWLTVVTNDAWYGQSKGPKQHMVLSVFRAVESRRWIVRCGNTGISCFIDPNGRIVKQLPLGESGELWQGIRPRDDVSFHTRRGDLFAWLCGLAALFGAVVRRQKTVNGK